MRSSEQVGHGTSLAHDPIELGPGRRIGARPRAGQTGDPDRERHRVHQRVEIGELRPSPARSDPLREETAPESIASADRVDDVDGRDRDDRSVIPGPDLHGATTVGPQHDRGAGGQELLDGRVRAVAGR